MTTITFSALHSQRLLLYSNIKRSVKLYDYTFKYVNDNVHRRYGNIVIVTPARYTAVLFCL